MVVLPVVAGIKCLRGVCNERLKYEVEYSLKKGTSENSYLLSVSVCWLVGGWVLMCCTQCKCQPQPAVSSSCSSRVRAPAGMSQPHRSVSMQQVQLDTGQSTGL